MTGASAQPLHSAEHGSERLVGVVQELSTARSLERVQTIVRRAARELTGADGAAFVLRDGQQCFYADEDAIAPLWKGRRFPMTACISGWVMQNKEAVVIEDIFADSRIPADAYRPTFVKSLAMVPIRTSDPVGAIGNYWARRYRASEEQLRMLQALADSTSIALENVRLIEQLQAAKEAAESASRLKDEFLAMISHELRTPLTPVVGWSAMLLEETLSSEEVREAAQAINEGALRELRLVESLLDLSQLLAGKLTLAPVPLDVVARIRDAIRVIDPDARAKHIRIEFNATEAPLQLRADRARLTQILLNLLSNAVKFTPPRGQVRVALDSSPTEVHISVSDTGEGIPPDFVPHLFELFRQRDGSMTRAAGGMGLGLTAVRHLVELHGGTIRAESPGLGLGSTFTVTLPR
jgi:two-component system CheB/CheR fusion protein